MHTKTVLFVTWAEPLELHVILKKCVGAYYRCSAARQLIQDNLSRLTLGSATQPGGLLER